MNGKFCFIIVLESSNSSFKIISQAKILQYINFKRFRRFFLSTLTVNLRYS